MTFTKPIKRKADRPMRSTRPRYGAMDYFLGVIIAVLAEHLGPQVLVMWMEGAR